MNKSNKKERNEIDDSAYITGNAVDESLRMILADERSVEKHIKPIDVKNTIGQFLGIFKSIEKSYFYEEIEELIEAKRSGTLDHSIYSVVIEPNPFENGLYVAQYAVLEFDEAHDLLAQEERTFWVTKLRSIDLTLYTTVRLLLSLHNDSRFVINNPSPLEEKIELEHEVSQIYAFDEYKHLGSLLSVPSPSIRRKIEQLESDNKQYKLNTLFD